MAKSPDAFRTISEVAEWLDVPTHVLRFWESRFSQVKPVKRAGGRRYYRPSDMELLGGIKRLLHDDGLTIRGVQKLLREEGVKHVAGLSPGLDGRPAPTGGPDNVVALSSKKDDPDAALSRWPFVDDTPVADTPPIEEDTAPADATASPEEDPAEPEETPEKIESLVADVVPEEPVPSEKTVPEAAETERDDVAPEAVPAETERPPFAQPPLFDESNVYFAGPLPVAGLARLSPRHALRHADALEQALERGRDLARSMDRVDG